MVIDALTPDPDAVAAGAVLDAPNELSALQLMAGRFRLLCDMALLLSRESDVERLADNVLDKITGILEFERCSVSLIEPGGQTYRLRTQSERRTDTALVDLAAVPFDRGVAGYAIRRRRAVYIPDVAAVDKPMGIVDEPMEGGSLRSILCLPLLVQDDLVGVITLGAARPDAYTPGDIQMARQVASCLALAMERQRGREQAEALDRKLEDKALRLEETVERLERTNLELDTFIYAASHDLRAPLLSVSGLTDLAILAMENREVDDVAEILQRMRRSIDRLDQLVVEILQVSRARRLERHLEPVDVRQLIAEVVESLAGLDGAADVRIAVDCDIEGPVPLDRLRVRQIVSNLVSNAIKYRDPTREDRWASLEVRLDGSTFRLTVCDNGIGIPEEQRERVFDLFYRGTTRSFGAGLGLYLVKQHVATMLGHVHCTSENGATVFRVELPIDA